jgi:hypothetical protein
MLYDQYFAARKSVKRRGLSILSNAPVGLNFISVHAVFGDFDVAASGPRDVGPAVRGAGRCMFTQREARRVRLSRNLRDEIVARRRREAGGRSIRRDV